MEQVSVRLGFMVFRGMWIFWAAGFAEPFGVPLFMEVAVYGRYCFGL